jgi:hypothetical protein
LGFLAFAGSMEARAKKDKKAAMRKAEELQKA